MIALKRLIASPVAVLLGLLIIMLAGLAIGHAVSKQSTVHEVDPAQFWTEYSAHPDNYVFIDVRGASDYAASHADGSINIPIADLSTQYAQLPKSGKQIALTCGDGRLAAVAYGFLSSQGFTNLLHVQGGLKNWITEGLPVEGTKVASTTGASAR